MRIDEFRGIYAYGPSHSPRRGVLDASASGEPFAIVLQPYGTERMQLAYAHVTRHSKSVTNVDQLRVAIAELDGLCLWVLRRPDDRAAKTELLRRLKANPGPLAATGLDRQLDTALVRAAQGFDTWVKLIDDDHAEVADWAGELKSGLFAVKAELERMLGPR